MKKYYCLGYVFEGFDKITKEDATQLTHINLAFGLIKDGRVSLEHLQEDISSLTVLRESNPDLKIVLSIGGWGAGGFSTASASAEGRKKFAESAAEILKKYKLDGIDIDWEYPTRGMQGIDCSPDDKYNFTLLLKELREVLDGCGASDGGRVSLSVATGADQAYIDGTDMGEAQKYLDYVQLMTYDLIGPTTCHHANLYESGMNPRGKCSAQNAVKLFIEAGVPAEKLVLGAAFYGRGWHNVECAENGGIYQAAGRGKYGAEYIPYDIILNEKLNKNGFIRYWDDTAKAPWLFNGTDFISYEDTESIEAKCKYIKEQNLLGIMYWEHNADSGRSLLHKMSNELKTEKEAN